MEEEEPPKGLMKKKSDLSQFISVLEAEVDKVGGEETSEEMKAGSAGSPGPPAMGSPEREQRNKEVSTLEPESLFSELALTMG